MSKNQLGLKNPSQKSVSAFEFSTYLTMAETICKKRKEMKGANPVKNLAIK